MSPEIRTASGKPDLAVVSRVAELRRLIGQWKSEGLSIALVPTMGALHRGHTSLIEIAARAADATVVSIFVNPKQFGPNEDLISYPRDLNRDLETLKMSQARLVFAPTPADMYPDGFATSVKVEGLTQELCGKVRPHFFEGVTTVVAKLLLQAMPDVAVFGEKDYQQLLVIRRMVRDLDIPVEILSGPVVREPDGLALSSRNAYLSETERPIAAMLNRRLTEAAQKIAAGEDIRIREEACTKTLLQDGFSSVDYVEVRDADSLDRLSSLRLPSRLLAAARIGQTRLIDNVPIGG